MSGIPQEASILSQQEQFDSFALLALCVHPFSPQPGQVQGQLALKAAVWDNAV